MAKLNICAACQSAIPSGLPCPSCFPPVGVPPAPRRYQPMQRSVEHTELLEASKRRWMEENGYTAASYAAEVMALRFRAQANGRTVGEQALAEMREKNPALVSVLKRNWRNENKGQG